MKTLTIKNLEYIIKSTKDLKLKQSALTELTNRLELIKKQIKEVK